MSSWHEEYKRRYAKLKEEGKPFFPYAVFKDLVVASLIMAALCWLAYKYGAGLEELADPTDATYNPRPEWYFLFLFQGLKFFPGHLEAVAAILLPGAGLLLLLLVPFLDRGPERHPLDRPLWTGLGVGALAGIAALTWAGYHSPLVNPIEEKDPLVLAGRRIYREMKCAYCHKIGGKGGSVGPDLSKSAGGESVEWLARHIRDPQSVSPGTSMPKLNLLDDEIAALAAYVQSLGGGLSFSPEAPKVFSENCAACHRLGKEGGEGGPDLSLIGSARDKAFIKGYIIDPSRSNPGSTMPAYKDILTDVQIEDLARYLAAQGADSR